MNYKLDILNQFFFVYRIRFYEEKDFGETLYSYDSYLNNLMPTADSHQVSMKQAQIGLLSSLQNNGLDGLLKGFISNQKCSIAHNGQPFEDELADAKFYNLWKLSIWDEEPILSQAASPDLLDITSFNKSFYFG